MARTKKEIRLITIELDVEVKQDTKEYITSIAGHPETVATSKYKEEAIDETLKSAREIIYDFLLTPDEPGEV